MQGDGGGVQTTTNLTPSCRGSSQILVSRFTMMPGLRLRSSVLHFVTQPLFWSESQQAHIWEAVPSEGQHEGQQDEKTASRQAWASSVEPLEAWFSPSASH